MKKKDKSKFRILILLVSIIALGYYIFFTPNTESLKIVKLKIRSHGDYNQERNKTVSLMFLKNNLTFKIASLFLDFNKFKPGLYEINPGMNNFQLIRKLRSGKQTPVRFVLNNIQTLEDLASKISFYLEIDSIDVIEKLSNKNYCDNLGYTPDNIMTLFIENTYEYYWNIPFEKLIEKMQGAHQKYWNTRRMALVTSLNLNPTQAYILASLVQKEYSKKSERSTIAGVILNRIKIQMPLQIDATCKYATRDFSAKRINSTHTCFESPYNTYMNKGLPPGPICMPEQSTIEAVLNSKPHNFIYYCANPDLSGFHIFTSNYSAHRKVAAMYQKKLNAIGIH